ncbi:cilia- and flagella-associated protein 65 [Callorhinchus milii]|uniref:cilia- and flagella-associated protein 65 n=1 Tax=Callorhinchus milii TaxID=7868 RepID=UPI001C3FCF6B|nr:cilia- and flagella-associated protein 65 [Callorhinchus milii]
MLASTSSLKADSLLEIREKRCDEANVQCQFGPDFSPRKTGKKKANYYGIEVVQQMEWRTWKLGIEYIKHLTLKNIHFTSKKIKFRSPRSDFFTTLFPQPVVLCPGNMYSLPITFCGLEKRNYVDSIEFEVENRHFTVDLLATMPYYNLVMPDVVRLPICAVFNTSHITFHMYNSSDLTTPFCWMTPSYFMMIPAKGTLASRAKCQVKVVFYPWVTQVFDVIAVCQFGDAGQCKKYVKLEAIAKFPHLLLSVPGELSQTSGQEDTQSVLSFNHVAIRSTAEKYMEVHNFSPVCTSFQIVQSHTSSLPKSAFSCNIKEGVVPANGTLQIPITFTPQIVGIQSVDYFHISRPGNISKSVLKVMGSCKGPLVCLQLLKLNFGCVTLGETARSTMEISNTSDVPTFYQFEMDCSQSVFVIDEPCGFLGGESTKTLKLKFRPTHPINCYRRVACLIHHQDPLFLDLLGTCHTSTETPAILQPKHIDLYLVNASRRLTTYPPDILSIMLAEGKLALDLNGALMLVSPTCCEPEATVEDTDKLTEGHTNILSIVEYFDDGISSDVTMFPPHVTTSVRELNFQGCPQLDNITPLPFCLINYTKGKVSVVWTARPGSPFSVTPLTIDIPPLKSIACRLHFKPNMNNMLYAAEMECFAYYKAMRDHRMVDDNTFCPPWCITMRVQGHTFKVGYNHFIPKYTIDSPETVFPPVYETGTAYRTVVFRNMGDLIIPFSLDIQNSPIITVKPTMGFVLPKAHQIFTFRAMPKEEKLCKHTVLLELNMLVMYRQKLHLMYSVERPLLKLDGDAYLYFKPTCVGTVSGRSYIIKNVTEIPLYFQWEIQARDSHFLSVAPTFGIIQPNESLAQNWMFYPQEEQRYFMKPHVFTWGVKNLHHTEHGRKTHLALRVIGEGAKGKITVDQENIDLGHLLVGDTKVGDLILLNNGKCSLKFSLGVTQKITGPCDPDEVEKDDIAFDLEYSQGTIPARSKLIIGFTAWTLRRLHYTWEISCKIVTNKVLSPSEEKLLEEDPEVKEAGSEMKEMPACVVKAEGVYPTICVLDARCLGSISGMSKQQLWLLFSLDRLNKYLDQDPTENELIYRVPTRHSLHRCPSVLTPLMLDFNFGAAPACSQPSVILLMIENKGVLQVDWAFLFPLDQNLDLEYWAESGEFDPNELHEMRIQDNKLFDVKPKSGVLLPGQRETIQFTYRHEFSGTDRIPVVLKLSHGREILLNFIGVTVPKDQPYVHFISTEHTFAPICIGIDSPPKQVYTLFNGGSVNVHYEIQTDCLKTIQEENYDHAIFQCLNPRGEILPGKTAYTEWVFSPLEAESYSVVVPIQIIGGDSALVTFTGIGYDKRVLGACASFNNPSSYFGAPAIQQALVLGQLLFMSEERITFGNVPVFSKSRQMIFLYNISEVETIRYTWHFTSAHVSEVVSIIPVSGVLPPGGSTYSVVVLSSHVKACFYDLDLTCEVFSKRQMETYHQELNAWEKEKELQQVEFTITEKDLQGDQQLTSLKQDSMGSCTESKHRSPDTKVKKYKTLPPIKNHQDTWVGQQIKKPRPKQWLRPRPPKPFVLHLGVTARSHSLKEFQDNFSSDLPKHYIMRSFISKPLSSMTQSGDTRGPCNRANMVPPGQQLLNASVPQVRMVTDILMTVLRCLLNDEQFQLAVSECMEGPIPYFTQLWSQEAEELAARQDEELEKRADQPGPATLTQAGLARTPKESIIPGFTQIPVDPSSLALNREASGLLSSTQSQAPPAQPPAELVSTERLQPDSESAFEPQTPVEQLLTSLPEEDPFEMIPTGLLLSDMTPTGFFPRILPQVLTGLVPAGLLPVSRLPTGQVFSAPEITSSVISGVGINIPVSTGPAITSSSHTGQAIFNPIVPIRQEVSNTATTGPETMNPGPSQGLAGPETLTPHPSDLLLSSPGPPSPVTLHPLQDVPSDLLSVPISPRSTSPFHPVSQPTSRVASGTNQVTVDQLQEVADESVPEVAIPILVQPPEDTEEGVREALAISEEEARRKEERAVMLSIQFEERIAQRHQLKRQSGFCDVMEMILENTLRNIIIEANRGEVVLTARPRVILLPPIRGHVSHAKTSVMNTEPQVGRGWNTLPQLHPKIILTNSQLSTHTITSVRTIR